MTIPKLCKTSAKRKPLFLAAEYWYETSPVIENIKKILDTEGSTSSSIIRESLRKTVNESDTCNSQNFCSYAEKYNLILPANAPMAVFEMYKNHEKVEYTTVDYTTVDIFENNALSCGNNCEYANPVENAEEKEAIFSQSLDNLNVGEDQTLIENFASISVDELE